MIDSPVHGPREDLYNRLLQRVIERLIVWERCLENPTLELETSLGRDPQAAELANTRFQGVVALLADLLNPDLPDSATLTFLIDLRSALVDTFFEFRAMQQTELTRLGGNFMRGFYHAAHFDPMAFVAGIAMYDVCMDRLAASSTGEHGRVDVDSVVMWKDLFEHVATGFNLWVLRRRWRDIFLRYSRPEEIKTLKAQYDKYRSERAAVATRLINKLKAACDAEGLRDVQIEPHTRSLSGLYHSQLLREDLVKAIFLQVTVPDGREQDAYRVESFVEQFGEVQQRFLRKSFFQPQPNGAMRFQTAIRLRSRSEHDNERLCVVRFATPDRWHYNQWGRLLNLATADVPLTRFKWEPKQDSKAVPAPGHIRVFVSNGDQYFVPAHSYVADLLEVAYPRTYRHLSGLLVNLRPGNLTDRLQDGDVVHARIDRYQQSVLPPRYLPRSVSHPVAHEIMEEHQNVLASVAERGRQHVLAMVNTHLKPWGFQVSLHEIYSLLIRMGYTKGSANADEVFRKMAMADEAYPRRDTDLCDLALRLRLRGRIRNADGTELNVPWWKLDIAECCNPRFEDDIVGNLLSEPPVAAFRSWLEPMIRVHKSDCSRRHRDGDRLLPLQWVRGLEYAIQITVRYLDHPESLQALLEQIYDKTALKLMYMVADGVNFKPDAHIVFYATTATELQRKDAVEVLKNQYGDDAVTAVELDYTEAKLLTNTGLKNPFSRGETDARMRDMAPDAIVERLVPFNSFIRKVRSRVRCFLLTGSFRMGKTTTLRYMRARLQNSVTVTVYVTLMPLIKSKNPEDIIRQIYTAVVAALEIREDLPTPPSANRPKTPQELENFLRQMHTVTQCHFVIMIDEFTVMNDMLKQPGSLVDAAFLRRLADCFENLGGMVTFVLVFQAAVVFELIERNDDLYSYFLKYAEDQVSINTMTPTEINHYLRMGFPNGTVKISEDSFSLLYALSGGIIHIAQIIAARLWEYVQDNDVAELSAGVIETVVSNMEQHEAHFLFDQISRIVNQLDEAPRDVLRAVARAAESTPDGWAGTPDIRSAFRDTQFDVSRILVALSRCDLIEHESREDRWRVRGILLQRHLNTEADLLDHSPAG